MTKRKFIDAMKSGLDAELALMADTSMIDNSAAMRLVSAFDDLLSLYGDLQNQFALEHFVHHAGVTPKNANKRIKIPPMRNCTAARAIR